MQYFLVHIGSYKCTFSWHFRLCSAIPVNLIALTCTTFQGTSEQYSFWYTLFYFANCPPRQGRFLTQFFSLANLSTFQLLPYPFVCEWFTAERLGAPTIHRWRVGPGGDLFIDYILLVSLPFYFVFSKVIFTSPQLRGRHTTIVGRLHHSCGEGTPQLWGNNDKGDKNNFLA